MDVVEARQGYPHQTFAQYHSELDNFKQRIAARTLPANTPKPMPLYLQGAILAVDNHDGGVLAMVGGRDFLDSMYNRAVQSRRPAGRRSPPSCMPRHSNHRNISPRSRSRTVRLISGAS